MEIIDYAYSPIREVLKQRIISKKKSKYIFRGKRILRNES